MRLAPPLSRFFSAVLPFAALALLPASESFGAVEMEYRAKSNETLVFRTQALEPPPLARLAEGDVVTLLHRGPAESEVKTSGGLKGWVRNQDLVAIALAVPGEHRLGDQAIQGSGEYRGSIDYMRPPAVKVEVSDLERSFMDEVVEPVDREQWEMRHDEH
jgi:hypothetical protein